MAHFFKPGGDGPLGSLTIAKDQRVDIGLWGGGPSGEDLDVSVGNAGVASLVEKAAGPPGSHVRMFTVTGSQLGATTLVARLPDLFANAPAIRPLKTYCQDVSRPALPFTPGLSPAGTPGKVC